MAGSILIHEIVKVHLLSLKEARLLQEELLKNIPDDLLSLEDLIV